MLGNVGISLRRGRITASHIMYLSNIFTTFTFSLLIFPNGNVVTSPEYEAELFSHTFVFNSFLKHLWHYRPIVSAQTAPCSLTSLAPYAYLNPRRRACITQVIMSSSLMEGLTRSLGLLLVVHIHNRLTLED